MPSKDDEIKLYDVVKIKALRRAMDFVPDAFNTRPPRIGDIATVVEIYTKPPGYHLECCDSNGITEWLHAFPPEDIELEKVA
jgi:hypothetical protein